MVRFYKIEKEFAD